MALQYGLSISEIMDFFCEEEHAGFTEQEIKQAEENVGASLPTVYREFLKAYGKDEINSFFNTFFRLQMIFSRRIRQLRKNSRIGSQSFRKQWRTAARTSMRTTSILPCGSFPKSAGMR